jgi:hypothetical protein
MLAITTTFEHIGHWIKMRQSLARFSGPESSPQIRSLADFIATTSGFSFSVHTTIVTAGLQLVNYFRGYAWSDGRIAVGVPSGPNSVVLFAATDDNDGGVEVSASGIQYDRVGATEPAQSSPAPTGPAALSVAYTAKSKSPDIYRLPKGQF